MATALPVQRFVMLEVPGPWVPDVWAAAGLSLPVTSYLQDAVERARARIVLIRRPGRHPVASGAARRWAVVARSGAHWGTWHADTDLLSFDPAAELSRAIDPAPIALVCTHGRHDVCCAIEGRPVVTVLTDDPAFDTWECSHLGGDRFAANILWLPMGWMLGGVDASNAGAITKAALGGRVLPGHFRGRCGDVPAAQAAQHLLMQHLGEDRPASIAVTTGRPDGLTWHVTHQGVTYRLVLEPFLTAPHHLTCRAPANARMRSYRLLALDILG